MVEDWNIMRKLTALFIASSLALGAVSMSQAADTATAQNSAPTARQPGWGGGHHDRMFRSLNLTAAQKQQIRDIFAAERRQITPVSQDERRAMHDIIASDS